MKRWLSTAVLAWLLSLALSAQTYSEMMLRPDLYTLDEIRNSADAHFDAVGREKGSGYKQYMRWLMFNEPRVDAEGRVVNVMQRSMDAYKEYLNSDYYRNLPAAKSNTGNWESLGPDNFTTSTGWNGGNGRVNVIATDPQNQNIIYAGTACGGLWKSVNSGGSWVPLTDGIPSLGISGIAIHPNNSNIIYILTGDGDGRQSPSLGVFRTSDGGKTWANTGLIPSANFNPGISGQTGLVRYGWVGYKMAMNPNNPDDIYVAMSDGLYQRNLVGGTWVWQQRISGHFTDVVFHPTNPSKVYAATRTTGADGGGVFYRSTNEGQTWNAMTFHGLPTDDFNRIAIGVTPANENYVYLLYGGGATGFRGLYRSTNSGFNWLLRSSNPNIMSAEPFGLSNDHQAGYDIAIAVSPTNPEVVITGGINIWKSTNGGLNWASKSNWYALGLTNPANYCHADIHHLSFRGSTLWIGSDGGVYRSSDMAETFQYRSTGLRIMQYYRICTGSNTYIGGTQDNGTNELLLGNPTVNHVLGADGFSCIINPSNNNIRFYSTQNGQWRKDQFGLLLPISPDTGAVWNVGMIMHPIFTNTIYVGHFGKVYRSNDQGTSWTNINGSLGSQNRVLHLSMSPFTGDRLFAGTLQTVRRTNNSGASNPSWVTITNSFPSDYLFSDVEAGVDAVFPNRVFLTIGGYTAGQKVYRSDDAGSTWTNISGSLPNVHVSCIASETSSGGVYIGTDIGVFYRNNSMSDWIPFTNGLPSTIITDLEIRSGENRIYAGTFGRGMWRSTTYEPCPQNYVLTPANDPSNPNYTGFQFYTASNQISSTRTITGGEGTDVTYRANSSVTLLPGFEARAANMLNVSIASCTSLFFLPEAPVGVYVGHVKDEGLDGAGGTTSDEILSFHNNLSARSRAFPNPFIGNFTVEISAMDGQRDFNLELISTTGEMVGKVAGLHCPNGMKASYEIEAAHLSPGFYILRIIERGSVETIKLIKQ